MFDAAGGMTGSLRSMTCVVTARMPVNLLRMRTLLPTQCVTQQGLHAAWIPGKVFEGIPRDADEGHAFQ